MNNDMGSIARKGLHLIGATFEKLDFVFREQPIADYGIDAIIEPKGERYPSGKMIAVQIKSGESYFKEFKENAVVFRVDDKHYNYWMNNSLPVIIVLYNPLTDEIIWECFNRENVTKCKNGWKIRISCEQTLQNSKEKLLNLVNEKREFEQVWASLDLPKVEIQSQKRLWRYTIIIVDDVQEQLDMLREEIENLFDIEERYSVRILAVSKATDVIVESQNVDIDVFVLDVARNESLKWQTSKYDYFGYDLYKLLVNEKPNVLIRSKFYVLSRLPLTTLRNEFDGADVTYLRKQTTSNAKVAHLIKEYLDNLYLRESMSDNK
ncbi:MAG: DUF4365 domain-containing protein [Agathobacter sp.]|nr:DUF4365 domain-containing protein [Agathobacter sp.]